MLGLSKDITPQGFRLTMMLCKTKLAIKKCARGVENLVAREKELHYSIMRLQLNESEARSLTLEEHLDLLKLIRDYHRALHI